jgi:CRP-like cAMP-binding protein
MCNYIVNQLKELGLSEGLAQGLSAKVKLMSYASGDTLLNRGEFSSSWFMVMSGAVIGAVEFPGRGMTAVELYGERSWFGGLSVLAEEPSTLCFSAVTEVQLLKLPADLMLDAMAREPLFSKKLCQMIAMQSLRQSESLMLHKVGGLGLRILFGIAALVEALSETLRPITEPSGEGRFEMPVNQTQMAWLCGVSRTVISQHLQQLERGGWIRVKYGGLEFESLRDWSELLKRIRLNASIFLSASLEQILLGCGFQPQVKRALRSLGMNTNLREVL